MSNDISLKAFFGFQRHPFPPACAPEPLFCSPVHHAALRQAQDALQSRLHLLITAPAGMGKSSLCRLLMAQLNPRDFRTLYLVGQPVGLADMLRAVAEPLGLESSPRRGKAAQLLAEGLDKIAAQGTHPVLILDEAQQLPIEALELLRLVAESHQRLRLSLVLVATEAFTRLLQRPALAPLAGRLAVRLHLPPLTPEQTEDFVDHAFTSAGMTNILAPSVMPTLHAAAAGSPRRIGALLAAAMQGALDQKNKMLTDEIVQKVLDDHTR